MPYYQSNTLKHALCSSSSSFRRSGGEVLERVCSKLGGGFANAYNLETSISFINQDWETTSSAQSDKVKRDLVCAGLEDGYSSINTDFSIIHHISGAADQETDLYFYHSDHLGSSSFITDADGIVSQHLQYLPYGELFAEQRDNTARYYTPYKFSGKEKDEETGYSYFGARYYMPELSIWSAVDPLADERSWLSPYNYCQNNPVMLTDPDGMLDGDYFDLNGNFLKNDGIDDGKIYINNVELNNLKGQISDKTAIGIANHYYEKSGGKLSELAGNSVSLGADDIASTQVGTQYGLPKGMSKISINKNQYGDKLKNSYDFISTFTHERDHRALFLAKLSKDHNFKYTEDKSFWEFEKSATVKQVEHSSWNKTSKDYKQKIYNSYGKYEWVLSFPQQEKYFRKYGIKIDYWNGSYERYKAEKEFMNKR